MRQLSKNFVKQLTSGELKDLLKCITRDTKLDLQIRSNYINVYYNGGNILRIKPGLRCHFEFDEMYFNDSKIKISSEAKKDAIIHAELIKQREALIKKLIDNDNKPQEYFCEAKAVMDKWATSLSDKKTFEEKKEQQEIAIANRKDTDFVVLDLEYAVSSVSEFAYNGTLDKKVPRFDIVAIHNGRLVVIELKKGLGAVSGISGVKPHMDCFEHTIGRDNDKLFVKEMQELLRQKQAFGLLDKKLEIKDEKPIFMFAYADEKGKDEFLGFVHKCRKDGYKDEFIYLENDHKLRRREL